MGGPYKRKKYHYGNNTASKNVKTKRKTKDLDEIDNDLKPENAEKLLNKEIDYDLPGDGQFYCVCCARHFIDQHALKEHRRSKVHKRRVKDLEPEPYTVKEAEAAGGIGTYQQPKRRKIEDPGLKAENDRMEVSSIH